MSPIEEEKQTINEHYHFEKTEKTPRNELEENPEESPEDNPKIEEIEEQADRELEIVKAIIKRVQEEPHNFELKEDISNDEIEGILKNIKDQLSSAKDMDVEEMSLLLSPETIDINFARIKKWERKSSRKITLISQEIESLEQQQKELDISLEIEKNRNRFSKFLRKRKRFDMTVNFEKIEARQARLKEQRILETRKKNRTTEEKDSLLRMRERLAYSSIDRLIKNTSQRCWQVREQLTSPETKRKMNKKLVNTHLTPELDRLQAEGKLTEEEAKEYKDLIMKELSEGSAWNWNQPKETQEKAEKRREKLGKIESKTSHSKLPQLVHGIGINYREKGADRYYDPMIDILVNRTLIKKVDQFKNSILSDNDKPDFEEKMSRVIDTTLSKIERKRYDEIHGNPLDFKKIPVDKLLLSGNKRWKVLKEFTNKHNILPPELFEETEKMLIDRLCHEALFPGRHESSKGTDAAYLMAELNNPKALPLLLKHLQEYGSGHTSAVVVGVIEGLLKNSDPGKLKDILESMPEKQRKILEIITDENSYLNKFARSLDAHSIASLLKKSDDIPTQEERMKILEKAKWNKEDMRKLYLLSGDRLELLELVKRFAETAKLNKKDTILKFLDSLTHWVDLKIPDSLKIIDKITEELLGDYDHKKEGDTNKLKDILILYSISKNIQSTEKETFDITSLDFKNEEIDLDLIHEQIKNEVKKLISNNPHKFIQEANKKAWRMIFEKERINKFLDVLPKKSDEKRNAFTHNPYDRTSQFFKFIFNNKIEDLELDDETFDTITQFVEKFGLSKTPVLFSYFRNIILKEIKGIDLPARQIKDGIVSIKELEKRFNDLKQAVFSREPMTELELEKLSLVEIEILSYVTGKSTHRFDNGRPNIEQIIKDWQENYSEGRIVKSPEEYKPEKTKTSRVKIEVNTESIQESFNTLQKEIARAMEQPEDIQSLKLHILPITEEKIQQLQAILSRNPNNKHIQIQLQNYMQTQEIIKGSENIDQLMEHILSLDKKFIDKTKIGSAIRELLFRKLFTINFSPEMINNLARSVEGELTGQAVLNIINLVDNFIKDHVVNIEGKNKEGYWSDNAWEKIIAAKDNTRLTDLSKIFGTHIQKLRSEVKNFKITETGKPLNIEMIPDRGFIGEMSGYLADVCYTAEYPLLERYPNAIPYKFVTEDVSTNEKKFFGSVLVFELKDNEYNNVMLVRGFDVPEESELDISSFIENFLDNLEEVAKKRGCKKIIIPGLKGAISNYGLTLNHMMGKYHSEERKVSLDETFDFNNYDLTDNCYLAREITTEV